MEEPWFLLFGGQSADGRGPGTYEGRTTNKAWAYEHYTSCNNNPYSTGYVTIVTDKEHTRADPWTNWSKI